MFDCPQNLREEEMFEVPEWAANKVVYQIFPSRFAATEPVDKELWYKAPITPMDDLHGNLRGIIEHMDDIQNLGIDVLYMTPIFQSNSCRIRTGCSVFPVLETYQQMGRTCRYGLRGFHGIYLEIPDPPARWYLEHL